MIEYDDGATPFDYDELKGLLPTHITTRGELDFLEMENINQAIIWSGNLKTNDILNDEFAARFHHRLVFIHPFSNGNDRHARLMADLILEKLFTTEVFSWGGESLANHDKTRKEYIKALKMADEHDYSLLLEFVRS
jgi:fido (protein-threonine AMPylation protein)